LKSSAELEAYDIVGDIDWVRKQFLIMVICATNLRYGCQLVPLPDSTDISTMLPKIRVCGMTKNGDENAGTFTMNVYQWTHALRGEGFLTLACELSKAKYEQREKKPVPGPKSAAIVEGVIIGALSDSGSFLADATDRLSKLCLSVENVAFPSSAARIPVTASKGMLLRQFVKLFQC
jgi:hypothetical protein